MSKGGVVTPRVRESVFSWQKNDLRPFFCQRNTRVKTVKRYSYTSGLVGAFGSSFGVLSNALLGAERK